MDYKWFLTDIILKAMYSIALFAKQKLSVKDSFWKQLITVTNDNEELLGRYMVSHQLFTHLEQARNF